MKSNILSVLSPLFDSDNICFVVDRKDYFEYITDELNLQAKMYSSNMDLPINTVNIQATAENFEQVEKLVRSQNKKVRMLRIPIVVFDNSLENLKYCFARLIEYNFKLMFKLKNNLLTRFSSHNGINIESKNNSIIHCKFDKGLQYKYPSELILPFNRTRSLAEYLEVSFDYNPDIDSDFHINGTFSFNGMVYAIIPNSSLITKYHYDLADQLLNRISKAKNCDIQISNSYIKNFKINEIDICTQLSSITGELLKLKVTELAFGFYQPKNFSKINWKLNSQSNEGISGVHIGIGDGSSGVHIDFIYPNSNMIDMLSEA